MKLQDILPMDVWSNYIVNTSFILAVRKQIWASSHVMRRSRTLMLIKWSWDLQQTHDLSIFKGLNIMTSLHSKSKAVISLKM